MKNRALLLTVLLGSIIFLNAAPTADAQPKDKAEIRQWLDQWAEAFRAHDLDAIMSLYAPDVVAYDIVPPLQYVGKGAYIHDHVSVPAEFDSGKALLDLKQ